jgi:hypothetical protein
MSLPKEVAMTAAFGEKNTEISSFILLRKAVEQYRRLAGTLWIDDRSLRASLLEEQNLVHCTLRAACAISVEGSPAAVLRGSIYSAITNLCQSATVTNDGRVTNLSETRFLA